MKNKKSGTAKALKVDTEHVAKEEAKQAVKVDAENLAELKKGRGRPVTGKSKTAAIKAGTHVKAILIIPVELHKELQVEAVRDDNKDMSDIFEEMLRERYNIK